MRATALPPALATGTGHSSLREVSVFINFDPLGAKIGNFATHGIDVTLSYRLGRAGKAELVSHATVGVVCVPLDQVGHGVLGAPAVHHLGA